MESLSNRIAYLQGLTDGLDLSGSKEGKIIQEMIHLFDHMADTLEQFEQQMNEQEEYIEAVDEDLSELETLIYDEDTLEDTDYLDDDGFAREIEEYDDEELYDDDDIGFFEIECPHCDNLIAVSQDIFDDDMVAEVICPECDYHIIVNEDPDEDGQFVRYIIEDDESKVRS
ncbi:MAG: hypothetical protein H0Z33_00495 [Bacillaceae bacterium]|nr:hypothetical protein [Bacillaceae bacterium]